MPTVLVALAVLSLPPQELPGLPQAADRESAVDTPAPQVEVTVDRAALDADAREALQALLDRMEGLEGVTADVDAGLAILSGEVLSGEARDRAEEVARRVEGISFVDNRVEVARSLAQRLEPALERVRERTVDFLAYSPLLLVALGVVGASLVAARWLGRLDGPYRRLTPNVFVQNILRQAVRTAVVLGGVLLAVELLDVTALVGALVGTAGVAGLALGFAFKDIVENYLAGVILSLRQPFAPHDHVVVDQWEGKVVRLTSREAILMDLGGNHVRIPNATVFRSVLLNYTRNPLRRFDFEIAVGPSEDLVEGQRVGAEALGRMPGVLDDPEPGARVRAVGDSSVTLWFFGWIDQEDADFLKVRSEAIRRVKDALEARGIGMPPPAFELTLHRGGRKPAPAEARPREGAGAPAEEPRPEPHADVSVDRTLDEQVAEDRRRSEEPDLLD